MASTVTTAAPHRDKLVARLDEEIRRTGDPSFAARELACFLFCTGSDAEARTVLRRQHELVQMVTRNTTDGELAAAITGGVNGGTK